MRQLLLPAFILLSAVLVTQLGHAAAKMTPAARLKATAPQLLSARVTDLNGKALKKVALNQAFKVEYTVKDLDRSKVENMFSDFQILTARTGDKPLTTLDEACRDSKPVAATVKMYPQSEVRVNYQQAVSEPVEIASAGKNLTRLTMKFNPLTTTPCRMYGELTNKIVIPGMTMWVEVDTGFEDMTLTLKKPVEVALVDSETL